MASLFGMSTQVDDRERSKKVTYGKLSRAPKTHASLFTQTIAQSWSPPQRVAQDMSGRLPTKTTAVIAGQQTSRLPAARKLEIPEVRKQNNATTPGQGRAKQESEDFDVPSSEEDTPRPTKIKAPGRVRATAKPPPKTGQLVKPAAASPEASPSRKKRRIEESRNAARPQNNLERTRITQASPPTASNSIRTSSADLRKRSLQEGTSAPARLMRMVTEATLADVDEVDMSQNNDLRSTPGPISPQSPPSLQKSVSLTPGQSKLWSQLLSDDESDGDNMTPVKPKIKPATRPSVPASHPVIRSNTSGRIRLADRLKQDSQTMDLGSSDDDSTEATSSEIIEAGPTASQTAAATSQNREHSQSGPKYTYAQTRSYLQETNMDEALLQPLVLDTPVAPVRSTNALRETAESDEEPMQGIRSVHELRAAGNRKRFLDDMEILMNDIKDYSRSSWSKRRSVLMELSEKLREPDFAKRFMDSHFAAMVLQQCRDRKQPEPVADTILCVILHQMIAFDMSGYQLEQLSAQSLLSWLMFQIGERNSIADLAKNRQSNMAKASQLSYIEFMAGIKADLFHDGAVPDTLTISSVALAALNSMILKLRKVGIKHAILNDESRLSMLASHLPAPSDTVSNSAATRRLVLSILEAESLAMTLQPTAAHTTWAKGTVELLASSLETPTTLDGERADEFALLLRLLLNITNNQPLNCDAVSETSAPLHLLTGIAGLLSDQQALSENQTKLDVLLLSLGLAINLAEHSYRIRRSISSMPGPIRQLTKAFVEGQEASSQAQSIEQSRTNVAFGYLAVLLGNLCLDKGAAVIVKRSMPDEDTEMLVGAVEEFLSYHRRVDDGEGDVEGAGGETWTTFTERLGAVVAKLRGR